MSPQSASQLPLPPTVSSSASPKWARGATGPEPWDWPTADVCEFAVDWQLPIREGLHVLPDAACTLDRRGGSLSRTEGPDAVGRGLEGSGIGARACHPAGSGRRWDPPMGTR
jgi:hypothetical protein